MTELSSQEGVRTAYKKLKETGQWPGALAPTLEQKLWALWTTSRSVPLTLLTSWYPGTTQGTDKKMGTRPATKKISTRLWNRILLLARTRPWMPIVSHSSKIKMRISTVSPNSSTGSMKTKLSSRDIISNQIILEMNRGASRWTWKCLTVKTQGCPLTRSTDISNV